MAPFLPENEQAYRDWRQRKLALRERLDPLRVFLLDDSGRLPVADIEAVLEQVEAYNCLIFQSQTGQFERDALLRFSRQLGLQRLDANPGADADSVTALRVLPPGDRRARYVPYTNRGMNWHTDGYYNSRERRIQAFALYCVHPASWGGRNFLFDHEMMYMLVRDQSPDLLDALMQPDLMQIPANLEGEQVLRGATSGPVFEAREQGQGVHMRYTSRPHNIAWKSDARSRAALDLVREILLDGATSLDIQLQAGQGIICNNILHGRQAFRDGPDEHPRLVYRARYLDAINLMPDAGNGRST